MSFPALFKAITKDQASKQRWVTGMPTIVQTGNQFMFPGKDPWYTIQIRPETLCQFTGVYARPLFHPDDFDDIDDPDEVQPEPLYLGDIVQLRDPKRFKVMGHGIIIYSVQDTPAFQLYFEGERRADIVSEVQGSINFVPTFWIVGNAHKLDDCELPSKLVKKLLADLKSDHTSQIYIP